MSEVAEHIPALGPLHHPNQGDSGACGFCIDHGLRVQGNFQCGFIDIRKRNSALSTQQKAVRQLQGGYLCTRIAAAANPLIHICKRLAQSIQKWGKIDKPGKGARLGMG